MQIERHEIRVFSAVVEEGTFSRAAERLNVSQSAVSQTIANLEHKLDAALVERRGKLNLTEAGKRLFSFTRTVIQEEHSALEDRDAALQVHQGMDLDGTLGGAEARPREGVQAQVDGRGIERVDRVVELQA